MTNNYSNYSLGVMGVIGLVSGIVTYKYYKSIINLKVDNSNNHSNNDSPIILTDTSYCKKGLYKPIKGTIISAGWDLYSKEDTILESGERKLISTGWSLFELPDNYQFLSLMFGQCQKCTCLYI